MRYKINLQYVMYGKFSVGSSLNCGQVGKKSQVVTGFNYEVLDAEQRISNELEKLESVYGTRHRKFGKLVRLVDVRSRLKHGQFETWLKAEFGWSRRTAYNFVYETFAERANLAQIDIQHLPSTY